MAAEKNTAAQKNTAVKSKKASNKLKQTPETNPPGKPTLETNASSPQAAVENSKAAEKKTSKNSVNTIAQEQPVKQKSSKKSNNKDAKKSAKAPSAKEKKPATNLRLSVPRGGQLIHYFNLTPAFPTDAGHGDWLFTEVGSKRDIQNLRVEFQRNPLPLERELERAVLVVNMAQDKKAKGKWRFALGGVATDTGDADPNNDVMVEIIDNGFTLVAYVQVLENSRERIPFGFVASFTDEVTGVVSIYASKDPGIQPVRPPKP